VGIYFQWVYTFLGIELQDIFVFSWILGDILCHQRTPTPCSGLVSRAIDDRNSKQSGLSDNNDWSKEFFYCAAKVIIDCNNYILLICCSLTQEGWWLVGLYNLTAQAISHTNQSNAKMATCWSQQLNHLRAKIWLQWSRGLVSTQQLLSFAEYYWPFMTIGYPHWNTTSTSHVLHPEVKLLRSSVSQTVTRLTNGTKFHNAVT